MHRFDWRAVGGLVLGTFLFAPRSSLAVGLLLGGAAWLVLQAGLRTWRGGPLPGRHRKETYWRGRRINLERQANETKTVPVRPSRLTILCLALGTGLAGIALSMLLAVASRG